MKIMGCVTIAIGGVEKFYASGFIYDGTGGAPIVIAGKERTSFGAAVKDLQEIGSAVTVEVLRLQEAFEKAGSAVPHVEPRLRAVN